MATFSETNSKNTEIAERLNQNYKRKQQAIDLLTKTLNDLNSMATDYSGFSTELNTDAAANSGDGQWQNELGRKDKFLAERASLKTTVTGMIAALSGF